MLSRPSLGAVLGAALGHVALVALSACALSANGLADPSPDASPDAARPQTDATASFDGGGADDSAVPDDGALADASPTDATTSADGGIDALPPLSPICKPAPSLIACFPFEGAVNDEAPSGPQPSAVQSVSYVAGPDGRAVQVDASSIITLPPAAVWNVSTVTIEMWFRLASLPATGQRMGLFDADGRYGVFVYDDGVHCVMPDTVSIGLVPVNEWTHIACVHDGTQVIAYKNGEPSSSIPATVPPAQSQLAVAIGANSPSGDHLDGAIDSLRVWSTARSADEIKKAAGH